MTISGIEKPNKNKRKMHVDEPSVLDSQLTEQLLKIELVLFIKN